MKFKKLTAILIATLMIFEMIPIEPNYANAQLSSEENTTKTVETFEVPPSPTTLEVDVVSQIFNTTVDKEINKKGEGTDNKNNELSTDSNSSDSSNYSKFNTLTAPFAINNLRNKNYVLAAGETISPVTGDLTLNYTDLSLPGRNGLDLSVGRTYQSNQSLLGDRALSRQGILYQENSTYLNNRYFLGSGWSFNFPSVEVRTQNSNSELYYHDGFGQIEHVVFGGTQSNLEKHYENDAKFDRDCSFSNGQIQSAYVYISQDQTKQYFSKDGRLLGIVDRFNNKMTFKHKDTLVANLVPNFDFAYSEGQNGFGWTKTIGNGMGCDYDPTSGYGDKTSLKYWSGNENASAVESYSQFIEVKPEQNYKLEAFTKNQLVNGSSQIGYVEYRGLVNDSSYINNTKMFDIATSADWTKNEIKFTTSKDTQYVRLIFKNTGKGVSRIDNIVLGEEWPLIDEITDSVGRVIRFNYTNNLYDTATDGKDSIEVTVSNPYDGRRANIRYDKERLKLEYSGYDKLGPSKSLMCKEGRLFTSLRQAIVSGDTTIYGYEYGKGKYSADKKSLTEDSWSGYYLNLISTNTVREKTAFEYEETIKNLGDMGCFQTWRVLSRSNYLNTGQQIGNKTGYQKYSYSSSKNSKLYTNETGYPDNISADDESFKINTTMSQLNGIVKKWDFAGSKLKKSSTMDADNLEQAIIYESYHPVFKDSPTKICLSTAKLTGNNSGTGQTVLQESKQYIENTYNDWGGLASTTKPMTSEQLANVSEKQKLTTSYEYNPTFKLPTKTSYYQNSDRQVSETCAYTALGQLEYIINLRGEKTAFEYGLPNYPGLVTKQTQFTGKGSSTITTFAYGASGGTAYPTETTTPYTKSNGTATNSITANSTVRTEYEMLFGNPKSVTDPNGNTTQYSYDTNGRLTDVTYPAVSETDGQYVYRENYQYQTFDFAEPVSFWLFSVITQKTKTPVSGGETILYDKKKEYYDSDGKLHLREQNTTELVRPSMSSYTYDNYGQLKSSKNPNGNQVFYSFDGWGRAKSVTDPYGNSYVCDYDPINRTKTTSFLATGTSGAQKQLTETYDQWDRLVRRTAYPTGTEQDKLEERINYDYLGNVLDVTNPKGETTHYTYSPANELIKVTEPSGDAVDYSYNSFGGLTEQKQHEGAKTFTKSKYYDGRGVLTQLNEANGRVSKFICDAMGLPIEINEAGSRTKKLSYDTLNRITQINSVDESLKTSYGTYGVEKLESLKSGVATSTLNFGYNKRGLISESTRNGKTTRFEYDPAGNVTKMTTPEELVQSYTYNPREQVESLSVDGKAFTYEYYPNGLLKSTTYPSFKTGVTLSCTYSYDNAKRLIEMSYMKNGEPYVKYNYDYDPNGNIIGEKVNDVLEKSYTFNNRGQLASTTFKDKGTRTYAYDSRGNRTKATGPVTEFKDRTETAYSWDAWDRLSNVKQGEETLASFQYDATGIRYSKTTETGTTTYNCDNNGRVITEYNEEGIKAQNIWGNGILARKVDGATYYYLTNTHGDVMEILDESGKTVNRYKYDEWGNAIEAVETIENPIRFAGEYFDEETGLYYLRARYYDPSLARFISKDSYEGQVTNPQSLNQYTYCDNNPIMFVDPTGHDPEDHGDKYINIDPGTIISIMDLTPIGWAIIAAELKGAKLPRNGTLDKLTYALAVKALAKNGIELGVKTGVKNLGKGAVKSVSNMGEFFSEGFGKGIKNNLSKTTVEFQGQSIYRVTGKTGNEYLKKGYGVYLDALHKDHLEVVNKVGKVIYVLNLDGTLNADKTAKALKEARTVKGW